MPTPTSPPSRNGTWRASPRPSCPAGRRRGRGGGDRHRHPLRLRRQLSPPLAAGRARQAGLQAQTADSDTRRHRAGRGLAGAAAGRRQADYTLAWRRLADAAEGRPEPLRELFADTPALEAWLARWQARAAAEARPAAQARAGDAAGESPHHPAQPSRRGGAGRGLHRGDLGPFEDLLQAIKRPFDDDPALARYAEPAPAGYTEGYRTFCGT
jgi:hypothetical protein